MQKLPEVPDRKWIDTCAKRKKETISEKKQEKPIFTSAGPFNRKDFFPLGC